MGSGDPILRVPGASGYGLNHVYGRLGLGCYLARMAHPGDPILGVPLDPGYPQSGVPWIWGTLDLGYPGLGVPRIHGARIRNTIRSVHTPDDDASGVCTLRMMMHPELVCINITSACAE